MKIGIVGFPRSGKTTLFNLLTGSTAPTSKFEAGRAELHTGMARVPDERLSRLSAIFNPKKTTFASFEVVDLAGIAKGDRRGLEAKEFRSADALFHVVRAFPDPTGVPADPKGDITDLETELILADLEVVERRLQKLGPGLKRKATEAEQGEQTLLARLKGPLEEGVPLRAHPLSAEESRRLRGFGFLSLKPILHCLNLPEADVARRDEHLTALAEAAKRPGTMVGWVSAMVEAEVAVLPPEEQESFLEALGLPEPALHRVIRDAYALLGLVSFFTIGEEEMRAWTIPAGATAIEAAAVVHSDMARGFIRAEVIGWAELLEAGSLTEARRRGILRLEGKDYPVKDGEVCHFRFHVGR